MQLGGHTLYRSGWDSAANDNRVETLLCADLAERLYEVVYDAVNVGEVRFTARGRGRADAKERHITSEECSERFDGGMKLPGGDRFGEQGFQARFNHRTLTRRNGSNLQLVRIDTPDIMTVGGEACRRDGTHVAEAENRDLHALIRRGRLSRHDGAILNMSRGSPWRYIRRTTGSWGWAGSSGKDLYLRACRRSILRSDVASRLTRAGRMRE